MPRKPLIRTVELPYHVTARVNNREAFPLSLDRMWRIFSIEGFRLNLMYGVEFQAFVLMPNHFHAILTTPERDLGFVMNELMRSVARTTNALAGRSGHLFGGSYHWSMIRSTRYYGHALKYVYRNPVKAKLSERAEEYPYSTLGGLLGYRTLPFRLYYSRIGAELGLPSDETLKQVEWINSPFSSHLDESIRYGLRRRIFVPSKAILSRAKSEVVH